MDLETFYYSRARKWIFCSVGILSLCFGFITLLCFIFCAESQWSTANFPQALVSIVLGVLIILIAWEHKKIAFYLALFSIAASLLYALAMFAVRHFSIHPILTMLFITPGKIASDDRTFIVDSIFILLEIALLFKTLPNFKHAYLWVTGVSAGIACGLAIYFISFNITDLRLFFFNIHLSTAIALLALLIGIAILFFSGTHLAYLYPSSFTLWLPIMATIAAIFLTLTTWSTYVARERELISHNNQEKVSLLKDQIQDRGKIYFSSLTRMKNRWTELGLEGLQKSFLKVESDTFLAFPWLKEIGLVNAKQSIVDLKSSPEIHSFPDPFPLLNARSPSQNPSNFIQVAITSSPVHALLGFAPFTSRGIQEKTYYFSIADAHAFFADATQNFLENENAITITHDKTILFRSNTEDAKYASDFAVEENFDFFGNQIGLKVWPLSKYIDTTKLPASNFQLIIGLIFSFTLFWALYMAQIALRKKREADKANREKTMFLANMSHEIRTPLHGILGSCSLLALSKLDEYQKKWVEGINKSGKTLLDLLDELLDMSKIEANAINLEPHTIHLKPLVDDVFNVLNPEAKVKQIDLQLDYAANIDEQFLLDGKRVRQILFNLLNNAIRFTQKGYVKLSVSQTQDNKDTTLVFRIEDTGQGISKERLKNIFKTYLSIDIRTEKGGGLGLAITKRLIELMKGNIEVESQVDKGTVFTVRIPVKKGETDG